MKKLLLLSTCIVAIVLPAQGANWLKLQGTEPEGAGGRAKVWGFIQPEYVRTDDTKLKAGPYAGQKAVFNQNRPDDQADEFNIRRARIGVRGTPFPLDPKINYFILAEFGNNGITKNGGGSVKVSDASVTLNHIDGARFRVGQFKYPGSEEGLRAIHVANYTSFSEPVNQLLLERFVDAQSTGGAGTDISGTNTFTFIGLNGPVGAFRDIGVQVFDTFEQENGWEYSYAAMIGNGNGITRGDNNNDKDFYTYLAAEKVYGGKGARRAHLKAYVWNHNGKRTLDVAGVATDFDRDRRGIGVIYDKGKYSFGAEYIDADGMIFNGTSAGALPGSISNNGNARADFSVQGEGEADGYYLHFGYDVTPSVELDLRYERLDRLTNSVAGERQFETTTIGAQYFFNKKSRFTINYAFRDIDAPGGNATAKSILSGVDDKLTAQLLFIF